jgi:hypothetical protein
MKNKEEIEQLIYGCFGEKEWNNISTNAKLSVVQTYLQCQEDMQKDVEYWQREFEHWHQQAMEMADNSKVTRFEVIDLNGRAYTYYNCKVELSYQDIGRTLKVFINSLNKKD